MTGSGVPANAVRTIFLASAGMTVVAAAMAMSMASFPLCGNDGRDRR